MKGEPENIITQCHISSQTGQWIPSEKRKEHIEVSQYELCDVCGKAFKY